MPEETVIDTYVDAAAQLLGLPVAEEHRPGVVANFTVLMAQAALVLEFSLDDRAETAPIFFP
jgi:hypothetical protein